MITLQTFTLADDTAFITDGSNTVTLRLFIVFHLELVLRSAFLGTDSS